MLCKKCGLQSIPLDISSLPTQDHETEMSDRCVTKLRGRWCLGLKPKWSA